MTTSSITAVRLGTLSSISRGKSRQSRSAIGPTSVDQFEDWYKPLRLEAEALFCPLDHDLRRTDLGLTNGAGGLDVNDDAEVHVDEIVVGVSEECRPLMSAGPLGRGIGRKVSPARLYWKHLTSALDRVRRHRPRRYSPGTSQILE